MIEFKEGDWVRTKSHKSNPFLITRDTLDRYNSVKNDETRSPAFLTIGGQRVDELEICGEPFLQVYKWYRLYIKGYITPTIGMVTDLDNDRVVLSPSIVKEEYGGSKKFTISNIDRREELKVTDSCIQKCLPLGSPYLDFRPLCNPAMELSKWYKVISSKFDNPLIGRVQEIKPNVVIFTPRIYNREFFKDGYFDPHAFTSITELKVEDNEIQECLPTNSPFYIKPKYVVKAVHCDNIDQWDFVLEKINVSKSDRPFAEYNCIIISGDPVGCWASKDWCGKQGYEILEFGEWCKKNKHDYITCPTKYELIGEAKRRGFVKGTKFIDLVNKAEFEISDAEEFNLYGNQSLYVSVVKHKDYSNTTSRIYKDGVWAMLVPPKPDFGYDWWDEICSSGVKIGVQAGLVPIYSDAYVRREMANISSYPPLKKSLIRDLEITDFNRKLQVNIKQKNKVKLVL